MGESSSVGFFEMLEDEPLGIDADLMVVLWPEETFGSVVLSLWTANC
jgi:hypothetical protein